MDRPLIWGVEFLNEPFTKEREHGFFTLSPGGGGPYGGSFPFKRSGDGDGNFLGLFGHEVGVLVVEVEYFSESSWALVKVLFCVLRSVWCVLWLPSDC